MAEKTHSTQSGKGYHRREPSTVRVPEALGESEAFLNFQQQLSRVAPIERPVLLIGERGTGKELAAHRLHYLSRRWGGPLVALNCAALSPTVLESELFGHEAGAFTGAVTQRPGRFEAASGGTLFLDEIGQTPLAIQEKILRVVEYGSFERVGSSHPIHVDVRIIAATHADLPLLARRGTFKADLLDRLSFEVLFLPPLRARREDIPFLAHHFAARMAYELGWEAVPELSEEALQSLVDHEWPGNIRELKNVVERALYRADTPEVHQIDFDPFRYPFGPPAEEPTGVESRSEPESQTSTTEARGITLEKPLDVARQELERDYLNLALQKAHYNQRKAARLLGLSYHQFRGLYRRHRSASKGEG